MTIFITITSDVKCETWTCKHCSTAVLYTLYVDIIDIFNSKKENDLVEKILLTILIGYNTLKFHVSRLVYTIYLQGC